MPPVFPALLGLLRCVIAVELDERCTRWLFTDVFVSSCGSSDSVRSQSAYQEAQHRGVGGSKLRETHSSRSRRFDGVERRFQDHADDEIRVVCLASVAARLCACCPVETRPGRRFEGFGIWHAHDSLSPASDGAVVCASVLSPERPPALLRGVLAHEPY